MFRLSRRWGQWSAIAGFCFVWYAIAAVQGVIGKTLLNQFPYPMTVTMVQLTSIAICSEPVLRFYVKGHRPVEVGVFNRMILPLSVGKFMASVTAHVSLWRVAVSYSHTVKATVPLFTVCISRLLFGEKHSSSVYLSLVPIISGVIVASVTEFQFDSIGLISALVSTGGMSLQNIFSKRVLKRTGIHQFQLLATLGRISMFMFLPIWLVVDARRLMTAHVDIHDPFSVMCLLGLDGVLCFLQNILAFTMIQLVTPLTYAVASSTKRVAIIAVSIILLRNPVSFANILGMLMAVCGVLIYNRAKHLEGRRKTLPKTAPVIKNDSNFNYLNGSINFV